MRNSNLDCLRGDNPEGRGSLNAREEQRKADVAAQLNDCKTVFALSRFVGFDCLGLSAAFVRFFPPLQAATQPAAPCPGPQKE